MGRASDIQGLTVDEVLSQRRLYGTNELPPPEVESFWEKLLENFQEPLVKVLMAALGVTMLLALFGYASWFESLGIAVAVFLATFVSTYSEHKNEESFQKLQAEASKIIVTVIRGSTGALSAVPIEDLVVGDYVLLEPGARVPADGILIRGSLAVNQQNLTGEALPVNKVAPLTLGTAEGLASLPPLTSSLSTSLATTDFNEPKSLFRGSVVEDGEGVMRVSAVGVQSLYGALAKELAQEDDRESPLQVKLNVLADAIARLAYIGSVCIVISFLFKQLFIDQGSILGGFKYIFAQPLAFLKDVVTAVTLAVIIIVVAVPEGLPTMIAIVLSLNMRRLLNNHVLVRKLLGIETAGSLSILFSDKTGTITKGRFEPKFFLNAHGKPFVSVDLIPLPLRSLVTFALNEATPSTRHPITGQILGGNSSDQALLQYLRGHVTYSNQGLTKMVTLTHQIMFNSARKFSAVQLLLHPDLIKSSIGISESVNKDNSLTLVKGTPELLLPNCHMCVADNGTLTPFTPQALAHLDAEISALSRKGLRVIAIACSKDPLHQDHEAKPPTHLTLIGVIIVGDEVRSASASALQKCRDAGIQTVMITGDKKETAVAVAHEVGLLGAHSTGNVSNAALLEEEELILTSEQLRHIDDAHLQLLLPKLRIVARAVPTDKSRLVRVAQSAGHVVGMTGDGVNDSAALKLADVGFAMGSGAEVAKEAADIVILDDNFASITQAVLYGRTIFRSIRKFIVFQSTVNLASFFIVFFGPFLGYDFPLSLIQLLWVNLVMDTLAAIAYGGEPALPWYMQSKPVNRHAAIVSLYMWTAIVCNGVFIFALSLFFLFSDTITSQFRSQEALLTGYFCFFIFSTQFNSFNNRTKSLDLLHHIGDNRNFVFVLSFIFVIQVLFTYFGGEWLKVIPLTPHEWLITTFLAVLIVPFDLLRKAYLVPFVKRNLPLRLRNWIDNGIGSSKRENLSYINAMK